MTPDRLIDLLVKRASEGVTAQEQAEIERLSASVKGTDIESIERAAAALALAGIEEEPMPANVRARLEKTAAEFVASSEFAKPRGDARAASAPADELAARRDRQQARSSSFGSRLAWFAAAASLLIAIAGWWPRLRGADEQPRIVETRPKETPPNTEVPKAAPTPAEQRENLLASTQGLVQGDWSPPGDPATNPVSGDVVWDPKTQQGYMRFTGLKSNDPSQYQYQLWIFDAEQDERYPIDGGVFDIPAGQEEVVVKIDPAIAVKSPVMFAVTAEKPGGVVVSSREQIVALAKVAAG